MQIKKYLFFGMGLLMCLFAKAIDFSFVITGSAATSAGIFKQDGTLIRTLWSGVRMQAGSYTRSWDGVDDEGHLASDGSYVVKVLTNNVRYQWEGVIGNTSDAATGPTVHHALNRIHGLVFAGGHGYFCRNQSEGMPSQAKFPITNPQVKVPVMDAGGTTQATYFVCTDGTNMYWAGNDAFGGGTRNFVYATRVSDDTEVSFPAGTPVQVTHGKYYASTIDEINYPQSTISGLAVQQHGDLLFVCHYFYNVIRIYNKTTGALVRNLMMEKPVSIAVDGNDNVWLSYTAGGATRVEKFHPETDGAFTPLSIVLPNIVFPVAIAVSPDNATVSVADANTSQQVKGYDNTTGAPLWIMGQAGGYANGPEVNDDKFYFNDARGFYGNYIAYQPDGTFWVGDPGNCRNQHYSANRTFIDRLMYLPNSYSMTMDANRPNRVFSDYLEFDIDYSKPLAANNGSWRLSKNWGYLIPSSHDNAFNRFNATTLSNGKTYTLLRNNSGGGFLVLELPPSGNPRFTGISIDDVNAQLYPDGSIRSVNAITLGSPTVWTIRQLTGFDGASNPIWAPVQTIASTPPATRNDPVYWGNGVTLRSGEITTSGVLVSFDGGLSPYGSDRWHLGGIKPGTNEWLWKTAISTKKNYSGAYPEDGAYDNGNGSQYAGSVGIVSGTNIFWGFHGEFWKGSQTNKWNQVNDDGLFIGQFGEVGGSGTEAPAGMAGNSFAATVTKEINGNIYLYHNDESNHSGIHRWKISNLNTIHEINIPILFVPLHLGLVGTYYGSPDLNNCDINAIRLDPQINFDPNSLLSILSPDCRSAGWDGFVEAPASGLFTFYTAADNGAKLWIDGKLIIDQWNTNGGESAGQANLLANKRYGIRLEYRNLTNKVDCMLSWSGSGIPKSVIPFTSLIPVAPPDRSGGVDLMEKLEYNALLKNGMYGWQRDPVAEDYTLSYEKWWTASTNQKAYDSTRSPDVFVKFRQPSGSYSVTRDLGNRTGLVSGWRLAGQINYDGNYPNTDGGGAFLEILDPLGKVIVRVNPKIIYATDPATVLLQANDVTLAQAAQNDMQRIMSKYQPLEIKVASDGATVQYGVYPAVTVPILDAGADWRAPKTMRLHFWTANSNYDRVIDIKDFNFKVLSDFFVLR